LSGAADDACDYENRDEASERNAGAEE